MHHLVSQEGVRRTRRRFLTTILVPASRPIRKDHRIISALQLMHFSLGQFSGTVTSRTVTSTATFIATVPAAAGAAAVAAGPTAVATGVVETLKARRRLNRTG